MPGSSPHTVALVPRWRELQRICCRCEALWSEEHLCADRLRHPSTERLLDALRRAGEFDGEIWTRTRRIWTRARRRLESGASPALEQASDAELDAVLLAWSVAMHWVNMPEDERRVLNAILVHAGEPPLAA